MQSKKNELERIGYTFTQIEHQWYYLIPKNKKSLGFLSLHDAIDDAYKHAVKHGLFEE